MPNISLKSYAVSTFNKVFKADNATNPGLESLLRQGLINLQAGGNTHLLQATDDRLISNVCYIELRGALRSNFKLFR